MSCAIVASDGKASTLSGGQTRENCQHHRPPQHSTHTYIQHNRCTQHKHTCPPIPPPPTHTCKHTHIHVHIYIDTHTDTCAHTLHKCVSKDERDTIVFSPKWQSVGLALSRNPPQETNYPPEPHSQQHYTALCVCVCVGRHVCEGERMCVYVRMCEFKYECMDVYVCVNTCVYVRVHIAYRRMHKVS